MTKSTSNWSILGISVGSIVFLVGVVRYMVMFNDNFRGLTAMLLGLLTIGVSFLYDKILKQGNTIIAIEDHLGDLAWQRGREKL